MIVSIFKITSQILLFITCGAIFSTISYIPVHFFDEQNLNFDETELRDDRIIKNYQEVAVENKDTIDTSRNIKILLKISFLIIVIIPEIIL